MKVGKNVDLICHLFSWIWKLRITANLRKLFWPKTGTAFSMSCCTNSAGATWLGIRKLYLSEFFKSRVDEISIMSSWDSIFGCLFLLYYRATVSRAAGIIISTFLEGSRLACENAAIYHSLLYTGPRMNFVWNLLKFMLPNGKRFALWRWRRICLYVHVVFVCFYSWKSVSSADEWYGCVSRSRWSLLQQ